MVVYFDLKFSGYVVLKVLIAADKKDCYIVFADFVADFLVLVAWSGLGEWWKMLLLSAFI